MTEILARCSICKSTFVLYAGDPISIPFGRLAEAVADTLDHVCSAKESQ